jgi:hypothetical protein
MLNQKLNSMKYPAKVDIAVLMLFFNRPESFQLVFNEVKKARPSQLFLYQDGPRNDKDRVSIDACRQIAADENIDWECEVVRKYQEKNYGCDPSGYMSHKWAFSMADKCIVLEDDVVPSLSFFPFCKEMLDKYENDERITMVAGFNTDETTVGIPYDYIFTSVFSIWGWASWRRVVDKWDGDYSFMNDEFNKNQLAALVKERKYRRDFMKMCHDHATSGRQYFESIFWSCMLMNNGLAIMPTRNLINNVGATADSTHYSALKTMPRRLQKIFTMKRYELSFPLRHPKYVMENVEFKEHFYKAQAWGHPWIKIGRSFEELWLNIRYGNITQIFKSLKKRIGKWMGINKHI